ncbi:hypothetical protein DUI87_16186 [Hirundo rustica rustica]|uniref:Uncharacterized protein n=1 Tax=Hirundo rustica rustica TaxID=333673 RepID=A0A3M0K6Q3_HIRRU|nr:hypothetical protein DUI87_16186 [Hirundo rustica rustica]
MALAAADKWCKAAILSLSIEPAPALHDMLQNCSNRSGLRTWGSTGGLHRGPTPPRPALHISFSPNASGDGAVEHSDYLQEETFFKFVIPPSSMVKWISFIMVCSAKSGELSCNSLSLHSLYTVYKDPFCLNTVQPLCPHPVELQGVVVDKMQDLEIELVKSLIVVFGESIKLVQAPLQSPPTLQHIDTSSQLGDICKFADGGLNPLTQIISKDIKQDWAQY